ncbi:MAG: hypothetical protein ACM3SQ_14055 [Betaproteobacteria bacterium]
MATSNIILTIVLVGGIGLLVAASVRAWRVWRRYAAARIVTCPETSNPAAVHVDAMRAVFSALLDSGPTITLRACSRWPERGLCAQPCLCQIESGEAPDVPGLAARWYGRKSCAYCGRIISDGPSGVSRAALLGPDGVTIEWREVAPERLVSAFGTQHPVCWNCHVAETFRRLYPELVVDRPPH